MTDCTDKGKTEVVDEKDVSGIGEYTNTDIYKIAAMMTHGAVLDLNKVDRSDPRHVRLTVCGPAKLLKDVDEAWLNPSNILKRYASIVKDLKGIVHA